MADTALQQSYREKAAAQQKTLAPVLIQTMAGLMPQIPDLLPPDITVEQFRSALFLELSGRPTLANCTQQSLRDSVIKAAMYGMLPGRDAHVLPFRGGKGGGTQATFVPNYFGICLALERTGKVKRAFAHPVYEGDQFELDYFADQYHHIPHAVLKHEPGNILFYYGAVLFKDGTAQVEVMTLEQIDAIRRRAPAHDSGPWQSDLVEMSRKTALKRVAKYVRLTPQMKEMFDDDEEREQADIPPERARQNIVDLFGDGNGNFGDAPAEAPPEAPGRMGVSGQTPQDLTSMWRQTLEAHWQEMPEPLRGQCKAIVDGEHAVSESEGLALAGAVLDVVDNPPVEGD